MFDLKMVMDERAPRVGIIDVLSVETVSTGFVPLLYQRFCDGKWCMDCACVCVLKPVLPDRCPGLLLNCLP